MYLPRSRWSAYSKLTTATGWSWSSAGSRPNPISPSVWRLRRNSTTKRTRAFLECTVPVARCVVGSPRDCGCTVRCSCESTNPLLLIESENTRTHDAGDRYAHLTLWFSMENNELRARNRVKSIMCSCFIAYSKLLTTMPSGEKCVCKIAATSSCTCTRIGCL